MIHRSIARRTARDLLVSVPCSAAVVALAYVLRATGGSRIYFQTLRGPQALLFLIAVVSAAAAFPAYRIYRGRREGFRESLEIDARFRAIFDQPVLGIVIRDRERQVVACNAAFRQMFTMTGDDDEAGKIATSIAASGTVGFVRGDGSPICCSATESIVRGEDGEADLSITFYEDITGQIRTANELAETRQKIRNLIDMTEDFVWEGDANGVYTFVSPRSRDILGREPEEIVGHTPFDLMSEDEAARLRNVVTAHLTEQKSFRTFRKTNLHRDGHQVVLQTSAMPLFAPDGTFVGLQGISRDITEVEGDRDELSRLATAIEAAGDAIIITNADGVIEYVNPAFEKITGYQRWEVAGQTPRILKSGRQSAETYERLWADLLHRTRWKGHFVNKRKDGSFYDAEVTISPILSYDGAISGFVAVQRDVTEHVALLDRLRDAEEMERLGRLLGGVAHEVRNPLNAIRAATATLELDVTTIDDDSKALFSIVHGQVDRLMKLMRDLLEFGNPIVRTERIAAAGLCVDALATWRGSHIDEAGRVQFVDNVGEAEVDADTVRMQQVIINLLDNALQHTPPDAKIFLSCDCDDFHVRIAVADSGPGLDPQIALRVFEPFVTKRPGGTGLGLSIVKNSVERHGGRVVLRNRHEGPGMIAEVFLPVVPDGGGRSRV